mgnify:CR=1 FL=1
MENKKRWINIRNKPSSPYRPKRIHREMEQEDSRLRRSKPDKTSQRNKEFNIRTEQIG